jgi:hypothetical protein
LGGKEYKFKASSVSLYCKRYEFRANIPFSWKTSSSLSLSLSLSLLSLSLSLSLSLPSLFLSFLSGQDDLLLCMIEMIKEVTAQWEPSGMQGSPCIQGTTIRDIFDSTAIRDEPLLSYHVFKFICIKLGKVPLL